MIGGAAGAVPVLVGWSAVTELARLGAGRAVRRDLLLDAARTSGRWPSSTGTTTPPPTCRCCPAVASLRTTAVRILAYTLVLWALTLCSARSPGMGTIYVVSATVLGAVFTGLALRLAAHATPADAMRLFTWSITYITLLFGAMAADQLLRSGF